MGHTFTIVQKRTAVVGDVVTVAQTENDSSKAGEVFGCFTKVASPRACLFDCICWTKSSKLAFGELLKNLVGDNVSKLSAFLFIMVCSRMTSLIAVLFGAFLVSATLSRGLPGR